MSGVGSAPTATRGLIVAAPSSGSGKTVFTLGLIRHLKRSGLTVAPAKAGPDYIDPAFHAAAAGRACLNLDPWAMRPSTLADAVSRLSADTDWAVVEGVMGLFDGAASGDGSTADLAAATGWPVVLVIDARAQGASVAALLRGFATHRPDVRVAGVVFNRVGSPRHARILQQACAESVAQVAVLGCLPRDRGLVLPERHLGLVQAVEHGGLEGFLEKAADAVSKNIDMEALIAMGGAFTGNAADGLSPPIRPLGQRIAVASDIAFAFRYELVIEGWRAAGAEIEFFSPLADQPPGSGADAIYLPGGYPELHGARIAAASRFMAGLKESAGRGVVVYGECGGYMVMGRGLVDGDGQRHEMASLLPHSTSFAEPRLHLGYRRARLAAAGPLGDRGAGFRGHEFHYARIDGDFPSSPLFECCDAEGGELAPAGMMEGSVMGSFMHLIDSEDDEK